ncbi:unnamed protein product [Urochloa decumbens]|uniref:Reverse transcriptase domain-containing protein n=1 Tax=Urochloa decumbens TaxID=240449 RepID=A0ABC9F737_9POAL
MDAWTQPFAVSNKVRLVHILKNLHTSEVKIYSDASREFIQLLDGESGGEVLRDYVQQSPQLSELVEAWRLHREKPGMAYILSLFAAVVGHPDGKLRRHGLVKKSLDGIARMILEDKEKIGDVFLELNSGEFRRQNAALDLLAAIVRRGGGLASEVAERFDFKMAILPQLAGTIKKKGGKDGGKRRKGAEFGSTRRSFVGFAMSFLEVGNPRLLRRVLQQKEVYSGVLRGIGGTMTQRLSWEAADIAYEVLLMVCTDPKNGLMPGTNLRGNEKRLLDLMKKLKATEVAHHKSLLLAIVSKRLSLCSAYMNEFPYNIEPRSSPSWFAAISLAADVIASAKCDSIVHTLSSNSHGLVSVDDEEVQSVNLLCYIIEAINGMVSKGIVKSEFIGSAKVTIKIDDSPVLSCSDAADVSLVDEVHHGDEMQVKRWASLKEYIQDEVHGAMPDPQVLLKLLSSASQKHQDYSRNIRKKNAQLSEPPQKKRRCNSSIEVDDIIIGGIDAEQDKDTSEQDLESKNDRTTTLCEIWCLDKQDPKLKDAKVVEDVFHSKLLDVLRLYLVREGKLGQTGWLSSPPSPPTPPVPTTTPRRPPPRRRRPPPPSPSPEPLSPHPTPTRSPLSPDAAPFYPGGCSGGRGKQLRWAVDSPNSDDDDSDASPPPRRASYRDVLLQPSMAALSPVRDAPGPSGSGTAGRAAPPPRPVHERLGPRGEARSGRRQERRRGQTRLVHGLPVRRPDGHGRGRNTGRLRSEAASRTQQAPPAQQVWRRRTTDVERGVAAAPGRDTAPGTQHAPELVSEAVPDDWSLEQHLRSAHEVCYISRSAEMDAVEDSLRFALLAGAPGGCGMLSVESMRRAARDLPGVDDDQLSVRRFAPESFLVVFSTRPDGNPDRSYGFTGGDGGPRLHGYRCTTGIPDGAPPSSCGGGGGAAGSAPARDAPGMETSSAPTTTGGQAVPTAAPTTEVTMTGGQAVAPAACPAAAPTTEVTMKGGLAPASCSAAPPAVDVEDVRAHAEDESTGIPPVQAANTALTSEPVLQSPAQPSFHAGRTVPFDDSDCFRAPEEGDRGEAGATSRFEFETVAFEVQCPPRGLSHAVMEDPMRFESEALAPRLICFGTEPAVQCEDDGENGLPTQTVTPAKAMRTYRRRPRGAAAVDTAAPPTQQTELTEPHGDEPPISEAPDGPAQSEHATTPARRPVSHQASAPTKRPKTRTQPGPTLEEAKAATAVFLASVSRALQVPLASMPARGDAPPACNAATPGRRRSDRLASQTFNSTVRPSKKGEILVMKKLGLGEVETVDPSNAVRHRPMGSGHPARGDDQRVLTVRPRGQSGSTVSMDAQNHNILVWNARGLNARCRRDNLREVVSSSNASIVCIQETKLSVISPFLVNEMLGSRFSSFAYLPSNGASGGILVACRGPEMSCSQLHIGSYSVSVLIDVVQPQAHWCLTSVYGPQSDEDKVLFLNELRSIQIQAGTPWMIAGDFNLLLDAADKNNLNINRRNMGRFRRFVDDMELKDVHLHGRFYTWSNGWARPTMEKLDRVLMNIEWELLHPFCLLQALSSDMSDHCPLHLATNAASRPKRRFHFENYWIKIPGYLAAVERGWRCPDHVVDPFGRIDQLLRNTAKELQSWSQKSIGQIKQQLLLAREIILQLDRAQELRDLSAQELELRRDLKVKCLGLASLERTMARLRSHLTYLKDGDANTKLFHLQSSHRTRKKHIIRLQDDSGIAFSRTEKEEMLFRHFSSILGTSAHRTAELDFAALGVLPVDLERLERPFSEDEVWSTIRSLPNDKAPGPDGFTAEFYKSAWPILKLEIMNAFNAFYRTNRGQFQRVNGALITLLPKKPDPIAPSDYRPISLIHSFAKLVAKLLSNRLAPELEHLVDVNQSAFIKKRSIHDNFKFVEQAAKTLHRKNKASLLLKLDISKAFDTVEWPFLLQVLQGLGFTTRWRDWIALLVSTASTKVLLNGEPGRLIRNARGLRQGDPLSPMLFILLMEMLQRLFKQATVHGVLAPPASMAIHHQCSLYADDVVLFIAPDAQDLVTTTGILDLFGDCSGLRTNLAKCSIAPIACSEEQLQKVRDMFPVQIVEFPIQYLGLPLTVGRLRKAHLLPLIDKVSASMPTWRAPLMNRAGRLTTVKAVMSAKCIHTIISLKVPDWVFQEIDKRRRGFLWAGKEKAHGGQCLVAWTAACRPQELGGLGIPDLRRAAYALRLRWMWLKRTDANRPWRDLELDFGFSSWKSFVTRSIFEEDFSDFIPTSVKDIMIYFSGTLLGKSVTMLHYYFASKEVSRKQRLGIVSSIVPESSELLDSDLNDINPTSYEAILKVTNELFAKISLIRLLLSPRKSSEVASERESKRLHKAKLNFICVLVRTMDKIFMKFPLSGNILSDSAKEQKVICFLEYIILKNIIELSSEIQSHLNQLKSIPFLSQFIRSSLLHRFNDPVTIKAVRCIVVVLSQGKFSADEVLELILGHSNFVSTITCNEVSEYPSAHNPTGGMLQTAPSILKLVDSSFIEENKPQLCLAEKRRIEIIRLLRVLYDIRSRQQNNSELSESRELVFLLLSIYGATLSETDLEVLHLMNEIESPECRTITEVDHLWGSAALKFREEQKLDFSKSDSHNIENAETTERRRALFRENIPVDSKLCAKTALLYCYKRSSRASAFSLEQLQRENFADSFEVTSQRMDDQIYDPIFVLRFSIHTILMGYIEPAEFSRLGLLAITLVSIASPDQELRMLGYECLGAFKKSLEASQRSKETWQLQLLLTYLQNGISEQWQRIPSIIAVFAAEASLTLLDSSHAQFTAINNFLMHSTSVSLQSIPLFPTLLQSSSVHFKAERLWMLRLLSAGANLADDAKIYKRGRVLELALTFCSSPVSDSESKVLVLKVLKKCVKLPVLAHHLVKESGLLLWLSSVISILSDSAESSHSRVTELTLEVVNDLISSRLITDWLQETALEQLSAISSDLCVLLIKNVKLLKGNVPLLTSVLSVITSTLRLSMKRKIYQPHFTLSVNGVFSLCQATGGSFTSAEHKLAVELGVDAILMNGPMPISSEMDK